MSAASHDLRQRLAVFHPFGFPLSDKFAFFLCLCGFASGTVFPDGFVLLLEHFPPVADAQLIDSFGYKLLHMETVIDQ